MTQVATPSKKLKGKHSVAAHLVFEDPKEVSRYVCFNVTFIHSDDSLYRNSEGDDLKGFIVADSDSETQDDEKPIHRKLADIDDVNRVSVKDLVLGCLGR